MLEQLKPAVCERFLFCPSQAGVGAWRWRLGFGRSIYVREVPKDSPRLVVVVGAPHPRAGDPKAFVTSLSHARREFLPLDGSIRAKNLHWETLWERGHSSGEDFLSGYPALGGFALGLRTCGFSSLVFAPFPPLTLHSLPCSVLGDHHSMCHVTSSACCSSSDACGCRGTCWDRGAETLWPTTRSKAVPDWARRRDVNPRGTPKSWLLSKVHPLSPTALPAPAAGVQRAPCQSHRPQRLHILHEKKL